MQQGERRGRRAEEPILVHQLKLYGPEDGFAIKSPANVPDRLATKEFFHIQAESQSDIKRIEVHVGRKELESMDKVRLELEILPFLFTLEVFPALRC